MAGGSPSQGDWAVAALGPGSLIAGYRVESRIGAGGMAMVLRAQDEALGRTVALKILAPALASDPDFRQRFVREARAVAAVDHPHIIPVYAAGEADGVLYLAMRHITGGDLRAVVQREGPLPGDRALALLSPVASALDAAHRAGLVHRDVKPANILIDAGPDRPEHPYLSDFGLAKGAASSTGLTGTGQYVGTPDYSAPEQISGKPTGPRTDQYALACVAYTILTGGLPFPRDESMAVLWAHMYDQPPRLTRQRPDLPSAADLVLARALAKSPDERYDTCGEFADALRAALTQVPRAAAGTTAASARHARTAEQAAAPQRRTDTGRTASANTQSVARRPIASASPKETGRPPWELALPPFPARSEPSVTEPPVTAPPVTAPPVTAPKKGAPTWTTAPALLRRERSWRGTRFPLVAAGAVFLLLLLGGGFYGFWQYSQGQYYIGIDGKTGSVAIFRGTNQSLAGISMSSLFRDSTLKASQLPADDQATLAQTISQSSAQDAEQKVNQLAGEAGQCQQTYTVLAHWQQGNLAYQKYLTAKAQAAAHHAKAPATVPSPGPMPTQLPSADKCGPSAAFGIPPSALPTAGITVPAAG